MKGSLNLENVCRKIFHFIAERCRSGEPFFFFFVGVLLERLPAFPIPLLPLRMTGRSCCCRGGRRITELSDKPSVIPEFTHSDGHKMSPMKYGGG